MEVNEGLPFTGSSTGYQPLTAMQYTASVPSILKTLPLLDRFPSLHSETAMGVFRCNF